MHAIIAAVLWLALISGSAFSRPEMSKNDLKNLIQNVLYRPEVAASSWSIEAAVFNRSGSAGLDEIYSYNPIKLHKPASNTKSN